MRTCCLAADGLMSLQQSLQGGQILACLNFAAIDNALHPRHVVSTMLYI